MAHAYPRDVSAHQSIARYLVRSVPTATPDENAATIRARASSGGFEHVDNVFVLDQENHLIGVLRLAELFSAEPEARAQALMRTDWPSVDPETHRENAASLAIRNDVSSLAVVDAHGRFLGAVTATALLLILRDEHLEDLNHMAGILVRTEAARAAMVMAPLKRAGLRLPWLLVGLAGSTIATLLMSRFEALLQAQIALAFFVPAIVYLAGAVGQQAEAVAVRGLSLTHANVGASARGELITGMIIGSVLSLISLALVWFGFGSLALASTVALAILFASSCATLVGFVLPWLFARLGYDPAHGSGPVGTVIQDVLSLTVYFLIAWVILF